MSEVATLVSDGRIAGHFRGGRPVTAYLKLSDYCNIGCDHCYLPIAVRRDRTIMDEATLISALDAIAAMVDRQRAPGAIIVWHGGEPLALPPEVMARACALAADRLPEAVQSIQTSLIPYREAWAPVVRDWLGSEIGSSIDFSQRTMRGSVEAYHDFWMGRVTLARSHGFAVIPGIVPSTGEIGRGAEIVDWMVARGFDRFNIDRYNDFGNADPRRPRNREHSSFLAEVFDRTLDLFASGTLIRVNTVTAGLGGVLFDAPGDRWGGSCSRDFLVVNPDGRTNACPDKISFESFSSIHDGFAGLEASEARRAWIRTHLTGHRNPHCARCPFASFCRSGCPLTPNDVEAEGECSGYHRYLRHVRARAEADPSLVTAYLRQVTA